jgi:hypothetical protein
MEKQTLTQADLDGFYGSDNYYRHGLTGYVYTDGIKYLAEVGGAYWLIDEVMLENRFRAEVRAEEFQVWKLVRDAEGHSAWLVMEDGNDNAIRRKRIEFTDFPLPEVTLFFENSTLFLPRER